MRKVDYETPSPPIRKEVSTTGNDILLKAIYGRV
jgi:hypothetical protein